MIGNYDIFVKVGGGGGTDHPALHVNAQSKGLTAPISNAVSDQRSPLCYCYQLTHKGRDLYPVISAMIGWGNRYVEGLISGAAIEAMMEGKSSGAGPIE